MGRLMTTKQRNVCLLYTSDAADEEDSVDLGGRRIIKKKKKQKTKNKLKAVYENTATRTGQYHGIKIRAQ